MATIFKEGDVVRLNMLPRNYGGTPAELKSLLGLELPIVEVKNGGFHYILGLPKKRVIGGKKYDKIPVEHHWVEAIVTVEEIK